MTEALLETGVQIAHEHFNYDPNGFHTHESVTEWEMCEAAQQAEMDAQSRAEIHAENAWLRYAEMGTPDTQAEEDYARMVDVCGYGSPYGPYGY